LRGVATFWHILLREVRRVEEDGVLLGGEFFGFRGERLHVGGEGFDLFLEGGGVLLLGAEFSDFLAEAVAVALERLEFRLRRAAGGVDGEDGVDVSREFGRTRGEARFHEVGFFPDESDVEHGLDRME